jgi:osomolarity two-component system response regulator SKN7
MNNKDALDNIRRKAPAARKSAPQAEDMLIPTQQMDMLNSQLMAVQQQVQTLEKQNQELTLSNSLMVQELMNLQKFVTNHEHVLQNVVRAFTDLDAKRRRESRVFATSDISSASTLATSNQAMSNIEEEAPPSPLMHASKLLNETNMDVLMNTRNLEQMNEVSMRLNGGGITSPRDMNGRASTSSAPPSAGSSGTIRFAELDQLVYPVGHNNGINPMHPEYASSIPYGISERPVEQQQLVIPPVKKGPGALDPGWIRQPNILLIEDDPTCRRIGTKFLIAFNCHVTAAVRQCDRTMSVRS